MGIRCTGLALLLLLSACRPELDREPDTVMDQHSYVAHSAALVTHVALDLEADFAARQLRGTCVLDVEGPAGDLVLDTRDLDIASVEVAVGDGAFRETTFELGEADPILGAPLRVAREDATRVRVTYASRPEAAGLQWLEPAQTAGRTSPFLYSQSQAIQARTWIPLQDSPGVRVTYEARIRTSPELTAVMSAASASEPGAEGEHVFQMSLPIPPYLIAIAIGDLAFEATGPRTGVYAEPPLIGDAAREFEDTEAMMQAVEALYGPYRWDRYDILVLPPAFPFGGMENPRLTFVSPTVIAGDKSLVGLIAHELAHSWSGNLVTNATWNDFWLNEGFTTYIESRIQEEVFGPERSAMEVSLEVESLHEELSVLPAEDQRLRTDLEGRDPDDGITGVPYAKGAMFLRTLEKAAGRDAFDPFIRAYFDAFAFRSITTDTFEAFLEDELLAQREDVAAVVDLRQWLDESGLPDGRDEPRSTALEAVGNAAQAWSDGTVAVGDLPVTSWTTQHWQRFLRAMPDELPASQLAELDGAFGLTESGNAEILTEWFTLTIRNRYKPADIALERFLTSVGRRKFLRPLYEQLCETPEGRVRALQIYSVARSGYHALAAQSLDPLVGWVPPGV